MLKLQFNTFCKQLFTIEFFVLKTNLKSQKLKSFKSYRIFFVDRIHFRFKLSEKSIKNKKLSKKIG